MCAPATNPPLPHIKPSSTVATANSDATNAAARLFQLKKKQILLGQDTTGVGITIVSGFDKYVTGLNAKVGKWVGMIVGGW